MTQYSQRHSMINHCDRRIILLSDTDTVQSETQHDFWMIVSNTLNLKEILKIYLIEQNIYPNHQHE